MFMISTVVSVIVVSAYNAFMVISKICSHKGTRVFGILHRNNISQIGISQYKYDFSKKLQCYIQLSKIEVGVKNITLLIEIYEFTTKLIRQELCFYKNQINTR